MRNRRSASRASSWAASSNEPGGRCGSCPGYAGLSLRAPFPAHAAHYVRCVRGPGDPRLARDPLRRATRNARGRRMSERLTNDATVEVALDALKATGATGEIFLREAQSGSVEIKEGAIESVIARGERGVGIRVLDEQRLGFAYTSDLSADGIRTCADTAQRMSGVTEPDPDLALAKKAIDDADLDIYQVGVVDRPLAERGAV